MYLEIIDKHDLLAVNASNTPVCAIGAILAPDWLFTFGEAWALDQGVLAVQVQVIDELAPLDAGSAALVLLGAIDEQFVAHVDNDLADTIFALQPGVGTTGGAIASWASGVVVGPGLL